MGKLSSADKVTLATFPVLVVTTLILLAQVFHAPDVWIQFGVIVSSVPYAGFLVYLFIKWRKPSKKVASTSAGRMLSPSNPTERELEDNRLASPHFEQPLLVSCRGDDSYGPLQRNILAQVQKDVKEFNDANRTMHEVVPLAQILGSAKASAELNKLLRNAAVEPKGAVVFVPSELPLHFEKVYGEETNASLKQKLMAEAQAINQNAGKNSGAQKLLKKAAHPIPSTHAFFDAGFALGKGIRTLVLHPRSLPIQDTILHGGSLPAPIAVDVALKGGIAELQESSWKREVTTFVHQALSS